MTTAAGDTVQAFRMRSWLSLSLRGAPWLALWGAFIAFGLWVHRQMAVPLFTPRDTEIYSFDFQGYATTFANVDFIGAGRFRHPLWGWLTSPVTLLGQRIYELGEGVFWCYLICLFAAVGVGSVLLLRRLLKRTIGLDALSVWACTALFLSFAHVWLLAGIPETFGVSMLLALGTLVWAMGSAVRRERDAFRILGEEVRSPGLGRKIDVVGWGVMAVLSGGVTLTQFGKVVLGFLLIRWKDRRLVMRTLLFGLGAVELIVAIFALRLWWRVRTDVSAPGLAAAWHSLFDHVAPLGMPWSERLRYFWIFFSEPVALRGEPFSVQEIAGGYATWWPPVLLMILYGAVVLSIWVNRRHLLVKLMGIMFLVDGVIHFVVGWGLSESHLYAGHWFYALPLVLGLGLARVERSRRMWMCLGIFLFAIAMLGLNVHAYFSHPMGIVWPPA